MVKTNRRNVCYESRARRAYWSTHIEAWLRSGVTRERYCREHRLNRATLKRWLAALQTPLPKPRKCLKKAAPRSNRRLPARGSAAFIAFWLMHIEAQRDSGLSVPRYARVHQLPERMLQRVKLRFTRTPPAQDWRELRHPVARSGTAADARVRYELRLRYDRPSGTAVRDMPAGTETTARKPARRRYAGPQKLAIVAEAAEPGVSVSEIARRHGVTAPMIFRWRAEFGFAEPKERPLLVTARVVNRPQRGRPKSIALFVLHDLMVPPPNAITVELTDARRVFAPARATVRRYSGGNAMMIVPAGVKVHLALGHCDRRNGLDGRLLPDLLLRLARPPRSLNGAPATCK